MLRKRVVAVLAVLAVFALGAAACGGGGDGDREDYEVSIVETRDRVDTALANIAEAQSRKDFSDRMEQAAVVASRAADDLDDVSVADGFEEETTDLTAALRELSNDLEQTAEQLRLTPELFDNSAGLAFDGWTHTNQALRTLKDQGISVEPIANH